MVKAELIYNPYLVKTKVRFNDQPPRINSLVEKYEGKFPFIKTKSSLTWLQLAARLMAVAVNV